MMASYRPISRKGTVRLGWLVGLYKRESFPGGLVAKGSGHCIWPSEKQPVPYDMGWQNWRSQGADAGFVHNQDIHAVRILAMDRTTDRRNGPKRVVCSAAMPWSGCEFSVRFRCASLLEFRLQAVLGAKTG